MLLDEINVNHEGTYDFFYLPIDFKNRCNVGYCFINFMDPKSIIPFVREFDGLKWRSFNSEKVCAITFARIQGKASMVARFQNSSLLEKDDEYRPLLFYSSGPERGRPEPFPTSTRVAVSSATPYSSGNKYMNTYQTARHAIATEGYGRYEDAEVRYAVSRYTPQSHSEVELRVDARTNNSQDSAAGSSSAARGVQEEQSHNISDIANLSQTN